MIFAIIETAYTDAYQTFGASAPLKERDAQPETKPAASEDAAG